ncbi:MAG: NADH-quinone oxidoreductase subunit I [Clostridia bacterium]|nr:NADH-quinone oxidoreductase subunit I [Clostridia bacterium]
MGLVDTVGRTVKSVVKGHAITIREFFRKPITVRYPEVPVEYAKGVRGIPALKTNPETGELNCTGCGLCARACPVGVIEVTQPVGPDGRKIQKPEIFNLDFTRCLVCNLCVEACPFDALEMADFTEFSTYDQDELVVDKERLAEIWKRSHAVRIAGGEKI